jgi:uncharacterized membrane protein
MLQEDVMRLAYSVAQWLGIHVPAAMKTRNNRIIVGRVFFYVVGVVSKQIL